MIKRLIVLMLMPLLLGSCNFFLSQDFPLYYDVFGYGTVTAGKLYVNSGTNILTVTEDKTDGKWTECEQVFIRCDLLSTNDNETSFDARLKSYVPVKVTGIIDLDDADPETIGNDGVLFYQDWGYDNKAKAMDLALQYSAKKESETSHDISLVFDRARSKTDSLFFQLRHNGHGEVLENTSIGTQEIEIRTEYYSFGIDSAIPDEVGEKTVITIEYDWYESMDEGIMTRQTEHRKISGIFYLNGKTQN